MPNLLQYLLHHFHCHVHARFSGRSFHLARLDEVIIFPECLIPLSYTFRLRASPTTPQNSPSLLVRTTLHAMNRIAVNRDGLRILELFDLLLGELRSDKPSRER